MRPCSTPSGITARITRYAGAGRHGVVVLNAFRHHGPDHSPTVPADGAVTVLARCSTPSGITARITWCSSSRPRTPSCAQRLPASRPGSPEAAHPVVDGLQCSTPSGITARITPTMGKTGSAAAGCSTPSGITARITLHHERVVPNAHPVVLNAFRHHGPDHRVRRRPRGQPPHAVLNAFRHHGPDHTGSWGPAWQTPRAQRLPASRPGSPLDPGEIIVPSQQCSTPSGITARITPPLPTPRIHWTSAPSFQAPLPLLLIAIPFSFRPPLKRLIAASPVPIMDPAARAAASNPWKCYPFLLPKTSPAPDARRCLIPRRSGTAAHLSRRARGLSRVRSRVRRSPRRAGSPGAGRPDRAA